MMAFAQDESIVPGPGEIMVEISAGAFNFSGDNEKVVFSEGVEIKYEDIIINAPTVTAFFVNEDTVEYFYAESSDSTPVYLYKDKETFTSKSLKAYVQKKAYFLYELRGTYKAKNAKGKNNEIILAAEKSRSKPFDEKNITEAQKGYLTTCEEPNPHYRFQANYIVVKESNEIIAYDLLICNVLLKSDIIFLFYLIRCIFLHWKEKLSRLSHLLLLQVLQVYRHTYDLITIQKMMKLGQSFLIPWEMEKKKETQ